ncbi:3-phosphoshikimate 1-carboxyvinyltransferase [Dinghuibacter silviterrae]|uniref:3-phosphoshikimate 1-carboxyvinyltransferase n=1 Tax=Dinghuibacter silviterrae TaxID=1539049 RepID=A0A4R8DH12_9BACT|nr:3-phosphoshikimate 1-carboxyvinyltransferase [Dinghuibacter silviterrae]TDW96524.1 3-phosphoshikimate 1-carboxyvinyltransferase [Dinghuibacter silviterrae]
MIVSIQPSRVAGPMYAPASKSSMQRACAAALLRKGLTVLHNPGHSNDDRAAIDTIQKLGAKIERTDNSLNIQSLGVHPRSAEINCGESGLGVRMFTPIAAMSDLPLHIDGEGSLLTRPLHFFDEIFPQLGIRITSNGGRLPLSIQGPLQPAPITVDGSLSSQFLTGLLMAYAASGAQDEVITVDNLKSKPYIDLTLSVLKDFGWNVTHRDHRTFHFGKAEAQPGTLHYTVEGDWSGGAFLLVAGAVAGNVDVRGLDPHSTQADKAILNALQDSGVNMHVSKEKILISSQPLKPFAFDATDCPDLFPPLVALAAYADGQTIVKGASRLAHKESDRATTLQQEFGKMGIRIDVEGDLMRIHGGTGVKAARVHSRHDHRIAMACAVAALGADGPVVIEEAQAVNKSYTDFYDHLRAWGVPVNSNV